MFICSVTLTKERIALLLALALLLILIFGIFIATYTEDSLRTNTARRQFLEQNGVVAAQKPYRTETLKLPLEFDSFLMEYEALQQKQGLTLLPLRGKRIQKYTYLISNASHTEKPVYANLFIRRGRLVACDLTCPDFEEGWIKPLLKEVTNP